MGLCMGHRTRNARSPDPAKVAVDRKYRLFDPPY
jgi:hypothetical protein